MKILITGGTGLVGSNAIKVAQEQYKDEVVASVFSRRPARSWSCATVPLDLENRASILHAVESSRPEAVIHCAAPRDEDRLEVDHGWGWRVMVEGTRELARACRAAGAKLVFVSSDWVFGNGGRPPYREDSPPCPRNYFGFLKTIGETLVTCLCGDSAVVRIAGVYGPNWSDPGYEQKEPGVGFGCLVNYYVYRLERGEPVAVWTEGVNVLANPTLASDCAGALLAIAHEDQRGLFHCSGRESTNRLELAQAVAEVFGFDPGLVRLATGQEIEPGLLAGRLAAPYDSRLDVRDSETRLGRGSLSLRQGLEAYRRQRQEARERSRP